MAHIDSIEFLSEKGRSFKQDSSKKEKEGHLLDTCHLQASLDTEPSYLCRNVRQ